MVLVNTAPGSTGVGGSTFLDVFFQSSPDNGLSWQDFAHVNVGPNGTGTYLLPISFVDGSSYPTTIPANQDGTMANNTISQYVIGRRIRAKYQLGYKQGSAGQWAFHVLVVPN